MENKKRILITGAAGTVGSALLKQIMQFEHDYDVTVFDIESRKTQRKFAKYNGQNQLYLWRYNRS